MSWVARAIAGPLMFLLILLPVAWASTAETWTTGIYDYESDDVVQAVAHHDVAALQSNLIFSVDGALMAVGRLVVPASTCALDVIPSAGHTRGPPLS